MKTKSILAVAILVLGLSFVNLTSVYARGGSDDAVETEVHTSTSSQEPELRGDNFVTKITDKTTATVRDDLKTELETKRAEAQQKVDDKKAEIKEKLADKRLETCKKREARINAIIDKSAAQAEKQLGVFEKIEERVKAFYTDKKLSVANYDSLVANVDEKHTSAAAAVDQLGANNFSCDSSDASNPGGIMKDLATSKNDALKEYRAALKDLIVAIKGASTSETETESTEGAN